VRLAGDATRVRKAESTLCAHYASILKRSRQAHTIAESDRKDLVRVSTEKLGLRKYGIPFTSKS
jgi:hypothetical protein